MHIFAIIYDFMHIIDRYTASIFSVIGFLENERYLYDLTKMYKPIVIYRDTNTAG